ncbi:DUF3558 domain-containing protein [Actinokineospora inagensis]|uniref:DUF3558 domain-containing protein n=1 Tax=Actinokineospora inagensis TaxID=103730 RepID=UPI0004097AC8|nr:DUF3558 domain-containing protein [Actinokineospora inagensis]
MSRPRHVQTLLLVALTAACSAQTGGTPIPATSAPPTTATSHQADPNALRTVQPCTLLPTAAIKTLGVTGQPTPSATSKTRQCEWKAAGYTIAVVIYDTAGINDVKTDREIEYLPIGTHDGARYLTRTSACAIAIDVTPTSRVDVQATGDHPDDLCAPALEAAKQVEPAVP